MTKNEQRANLGPNLFQVPRLNKIGGLRLEQHLTLKADDQLWHHLMEAAKMIHIIYISYTTQSRERPD